MGKKDAGDVVTDFLRKIGPEAKTLAGKLAKQAARGAVRGAVAATLAGEDEGSSVAAPSSCLRCKHTSERARRVAHQLKLIAGHVEQLETVDPLNRGINVARLRDLAAELDPQR